MSPFPIAKIIPRKIDRLDFSNFQDEYNEDIIYLYNKLKENFPKFMKKIEFESFLQFIYKEYLRI